MKTFNKEMTLNEETFTIDSVKNLEYDVYLLDVTPSMARGLLLATIGNRDPKRNNIDSIKRSIERGEYYYDVPGSGIAFNKDGKLTNGHHTLAAIEESGKTVTVKMEVSTDHLEYADTGKTRSVRDSLKMSDHEEIADYAALIKNILRGKNNVTITNRGYSNEFQRSEYISFGVEHLDKLSHIYDTDKALRKKYDCIGNYSKGEPSVIGAFRYDLIYEKGYDENLVNNFMYGILSKDTQENKRIDKLRKQLVNTDSRAPKREKMLFDKFAEKVYNQFKLYEKEETKGKKHMILA